MFKKLIALSLVSSALTFSTFAFAEYKVCLIEGKFTVAGKKMEIKDCLQNTGVPQEQFKKTCNVLAKTVTASGGKITYMAACPEQPQGSCAGFFGAAITSYHYKRDAEDLAIAKRGCEAQGGKWE